MKVLLFLSAVIFAAYATEADKPSDDIFHVIHHTVQWIRQHHINVMKQHYDHAQRVANAQRASYNRARNNVNKLRADYLRYANQQRAAAHNYQNWGRQENRAGGTWGRIHNRVVHLRDRCKKNRKKWTAYEREQAKSTVDTYRMYINQRNKALKYKAKYDMYRRHAKTYQKQMQKLQNQINRLNNMKNKLQRQQRNNQNQIRNYQRMVRSGNWQTQQAKKRTDRFKRQHQNAVNQLRNGVKRCNQDMKNLMNEEHKAKQRQMQLKRKYDYYRQRSAHFQRLFERTHQAWRKANSHLGHFRSVSQRADHDARQWKIRYDHAKG